MRLRSWVIDGADELPRVESGELPNGLVVVFSPARSRKDAAIAMIRRILFSTPGNGKARASARLSGENGDFELSTNGTPGSETLRRLSGEPAGRDDLGRLFGQAERSELRCLFDFTGNGFDQGLLNRRLDLSGRAANSPFRRRMQEILGEEGRGEIEALLSELDDLESRLREALARENSYHDNNLAERQATDTVGRLCAELADLRRRRERLKAYTGLWPTWLKRIAVEKELSGLEEIDQFPDSELSIVEAQQAAQAAAEILQSVRKQHRQTRAELEALPPAGDRHEIVGRVDAITAELPGYRQQMTAFARARARHDELTTLVPELGKRVAGQSQETDFDPAKFDLKAAREWLNRSESFAEREAVTRASLERTRATLKQLRNERQRAVRAAKTLAVQLDDSDEHWRALWSLRDDLEQLWEIQSQGEAAARTAEQRLEALEGLDRKRYSTPGPMLGRILWIVVAAAFAAALWKTKQEDQLMAVALSGVAVAAALGDILLGWRRRWAQLRNREGEAKEERLRYDLDRARQLRDMRWRSAEEITRRIEVAAKALGLSSVPTPEEVDAAEESLFEASRRLPRRGPLAETALAIHDTRDEEELFMAQVRELRQAKEASALEWEEWKTTVNLPARLEQEDLTTYMCEYDRWRELDIEKTRVDQELRQLAPALERWEGNARALLIDVGLEVDESLCGRDLEDQLTMLRDGAYRSLRLLTRHTELGERIAQLDRDLAQAEHQATERQRVFEELRRQAGTGDEAEFERRKQIFQRRQGLSKLLLKREGEFVRLLAEQRLADDSEVRAELSSGNADVWAEQGYDIDTEIEHLESRMEVASHERAVAAAACRAIETSTEVTALNQERACLREEIHRLANEWRSLALAEALVDDASKSLSEGGSVLMEASVSLRKLTLGEMVRIAMPETGDHLIVVDRSGEQHIVNGNLTPELRRQINLSLQLSMARDFVRGGGPIPVVMDEVLRDLDTQQTAVTAAEIASLAEQQQVFYFTTDQASVDALRAAGDVSRVLTI